MNKKFTLALLTSLGMSLAAIANSIGVVNFATCITDSKSGQKEQASFEALKKQMTSLLEDTEKQLREISNKFQDPEYLDGLSPEAEEELKIKFRTLNEELNRYQNQYYQVLNQANMKLVQTMGNNINSAAETVAKDKKLDMVINKEAFFFHNNKLDVTTLVIKEMDRRFEEEQKAQASNAQPNPVK